ncbi:hypothetical protein LH935_14940 [Gordonia polyisoprenivorans]|uniref:hypothetical protein n=1 Tax=Gordonia polyisoprenivorans TaxID=84595 RepID=UPI002234AE12|nr:hypothetical protein LH935_14940 [Gordonia polyisoprenivorans]
MKTTNSIRTRIAAAVLATGAAAAITGGIVGTGAANAAVPEQGDYALILQAHLPPSTGAGVLSMVGIPVGAAPASIHGDVLTIAGQSGQLHPFHGGRLDSGERAVIAGVPVVVWDAEPGDSVLAVDIAGIPNAANLRR